MGVIIPLNASQLTFKFALEGDIEEQVITLGLEETVGADPEAFAVHAYTVSSASGMPFNPAGMMTPYTFLGVSCTTMTGSGPVTFEELDPETGTAGGNPLPSNCALLVKKNTGLGGRRNRGRFFVPLFGLTDANVDPLGNINTLTATQVIYSAWYDALQANSTLPPVALLHSDGGPATAITSFTVDGRIATQRTRMR